MLRLQTQIPHVHSFSCDSHSCVRLCPESKMICISCLETATLQLMQYCVLVRCSLALSSWLPTSPRQEKVSCDSFCLRTARSREDSSAQKYYTSNTHWSQTQRKRSTFAEPGHVETAANSNSTPPTTDCVVDSRAGVIPQLAVLQIPTTRRQRR